MQFAEFKPEYHKTSNNAYLELRNNKLKSGIVAEEKESVGRTAKLILEYYREDVGFTTDPFSGSVARTYIANSTDVCILIKLSAPILKDT